MTIGLKAQSQACLGSLLVIEGYRLSCLYDAMLKNSSCKWECNTITFGTWNEIYPALVSFGGASVAIV